MVNEKGEFVEGKFLGYMLDADRAGLQLTVHAIGDEANHLLLNYLEELNKQNGKRDRRFRLVHAQVVAPQDFKRLGQLGIVAEVQPFHLSDDMRWMEERIGHERSKGAYAFKSIQASGAILSFGTDWPGTSASEYPINPMLGLYAAVTRQTTSGKPEAGWFPDERISIEDAIRAYTYNTAYANFEEKIKGSIEVGKLADLTVLSKNLLKVAPKELLKTEVVYTIVNGKVVYQKMVNSGCAVAQCVNAVCSSCFASVSCDFVDRPLVRPDQNDPRNHTKRTRSKIDENLNRTDESLRNLIAAVDRYFSAGGRNCES